MPASVAIIGRPNTGKSTLFNKILGKRISIVSPISGTTRDPVTALYKGGKLDILFVDTGGLEFSGTRGVIETNVQLQARMAIEEADLILFCIDTKDPLTSTDEDAIRFLWKKAGEKKILLVGTKYEGKKHAISEHDLEAISLGEGSPVVISAFQNEGISELLGRVEKILRKQGFRKEKDKPKNTISLAVLGRPNVGKSSLINALTRTEKLIVSNIPGTTRDSVDIHFEKEGQQYCLIDTAGMRRKAKVEEDIEKFSVMRTLASLSRADVALLLLDPQEGITHQDKYIIEEILEAKTGLLLLVNKWDLKEKGEEAQKIFYRYAQKEFAFIPWAPLLFISAQEKKNISRIFPHVQQIFEERKKRIATSELNVFLQEVQHLHPMSGVKNTHPRVKYGAQVGINPPHFVFKGARLDAIHFSSRRYLENRLRDAFGFEGTPIQIEMSTQKNPYLQHPKIRYRKNGKRNF